jgi:hypothetical protein
MATMAYRDQDEDPTTAEAIEQIRLDTRDSDRSAARARLGILGYVKQAMG